MRVASRPRRSRHDGGFTLVELLVSMFMFALVLALLSSAVTLMFHSLRKQQGQADDLDIGRKVVLLLDQQIRYANAVTQPGTSVGAGCGASPTQPCYVEWQSGDMGAGQPQSCTQWRYDPTAMTLAYRMWSVTPQPVAAPTATVAPTPTATAMSAPSGWVVEGFHVLPVTGQPIFTTTAVPAGQRGSTAQHAQVSFGFNVRSGMPSTTRLTQATFAAGNTIGITTPSAVCAAVTSGSIRP